MARTRVSHNMCTGGETEPDLAHSVFLRTRRTRSQCYRQVQEFQILFDSDRIRSSALSTKICGWELCFSESTQAATQDSVMKLQTTALLWLCEFKKPEQEARILSLGRSGWEMEGSELFCCAGIGVWRHDRELSHLL